MVLELINIEKGNEANFQFCEMRQNQYERSFFNMDNLDTIISNGHQIFFETTKAENGNKCYYGQNY